ncbi:MAG TPA: SPOR domain-containing protein [Thioalkalivibrio sp.]|nr:SPOR domain-containing protein [Thioalkalivibrio sp.]
MRYLFLLLVLLNLGYWGWQQTLSPPPPAAPARVPADVAPLLLLSERETGVTPLAVAPAAGPANESPAAEPVPDALRCYTLGPLRSPESAQALAALIEAEGVPVSMREREEEEIAGYWVYLPAFDSRRAAMAVARELADKGVKDYYVVPNGDYVNAVSLGLFSEPQRADRRTRQIAALGYDAITSVRYRTRTLYWLDYDERGERRVPAQIWEHATTDTESVQRISRDCN